MPVPAVTTEQMREVDRIAVEETGPALLQMMENAGRSLAELVLQQLGEGYETACVLVLAGEGGMEGEESARHTVWQAGWARLSCIWRGSGRWQRKQARNRPLLSLFAVQPRPIAELAP